MGANKGLVGCIESLVVEGTGNVHTYDIFYPESDDVISGMGISEWLKLSHDFQAQIYC